MHACKVQLLMLLNTTHTCLYRVHIRFAAHVCLLANIKFKLRLRQCVVCVFNFAVYFSFCLCCVFNFLILFRFQSSVVSCSNHFFSWKHCIFLCVKNAMRVSLTKLKKNLHKMWWRRRAGKTWCVLLTIRCIIV